MPASGFSDKEPEAKKETTGAYFWVFHEFKPDAAEAWWAQMGVVMGDADKFAAMVKGHVEAGFFNHSFVPVGGDKPAVCIWECSTDCSLEEFQAFIDGPLGPGGDGAMVNRSFKVAPGANVPSAKFAKA